jgi:hypothetical protein
VIEALRECIARNRARAAGARSAARAAAPALDPASAEVAALAAALAAPAAAASIRRDPYWPKWDSPWWQMALLRELGLASAIPRALAATLAATAPAHYLPGFPLREEEIPPGADPYRHILCHCALGTLACLLAARGLRIADAFPEFEAWCASYQLPDGGWNCDEQAYTRATPRSSFLSTAALLEALLEPGVPAPRRLLDRGAGYLLARHLCRSLSRGLAVADARWLRPVFPRFYEYDLLRGLTLVSRWAERTASPLPVAAIADAAAVLDTATDAAGCLAPAPRTLAGRWTLRPLPDGGWERAEQGTTVFPLLEEANRADRPSPALTMEWYDTCDRLAALDAKGLLREG